MADMSWFRIKGGKNLRKHNSSSMAWLWSAFFSLSIESCTVDGCFRNLVGSFHRDAYIVYYSRTPAKEEIILIWVPCLSIARSVGKMKLVSIVKMKIYIQWLLYMKKIYIQRLLYMKLHGNFIWYSFMSLCYCSKRI